MLAPAIKSIMNLMPLLPLDKLESQLNKSMQNVIAKNTTDDCSIIIITRDNFDGYSNLSKDEDVDCFKLMTTENNTIVLTQSYICYSKRDH